MRHDTLWGNHELLKHNLTFITICLEVGYTAVRLVLLRCLVITYTIAVHKGNGLSNEGDSIAL